MKKGFADALLNGSENLNSMNREIEQTIKILIGTIEIALVDMLKPNAGESTWGYPDESDGWSVSVIFNPAKVRKARYCFRLWSKNKCIYKFERDGTQLDKIEVQTCDIQTVRSDLDSLVAFMLEKLPGLEDPLRPMFMAADPE